MDKREIKRQMAEMELRRFAFIREQSLNEDNLVNEIYENLNKSFKRISILEGAGLGISPDVKDSLNRINGRLHEINGLLNEAEELQEKTMSLKPSIQLELDSDGSLLIHKHEDVNFMSIYSNSHRLLKEYEKVDNIDGIKYELYKLYMMVVLIDKKYLYNNTITKVLVSKDKKNSMVRTKTFILTDFYKYLRYVLSKEKDFNFNQEFMKTDFGVETYKIDDRIVKAANILRKII